MLPVLGGVHGTTILPHPSSPAPTKEGVQNLHISKKLNVGEQLTKDPWKQKGPGTAGLPVDLLYDPCGRWGAGLWPPFSAHMVKPDANLTASAGAPGLGGRLPRARLPHE